jgi:hypothetical protein
MARTNISSKSKQLNSDDGSVLVSVIHGEQSRLGVTLQWLTDLTGYDITVKVVEGNNLQGTGSLPEDRLVGGEIVDLTIFDATPSDNSFEIVIPQTLISNWSTTPEPNQPIFGFIELEVKDTGAGDAQLVWKPFRGLIEIRYSPTEET